MELPEAPQLSSLLLLVRTPLAALSTLLLITAWGLAGARAVVLPTATGAASNGWIRGFSALILLSAAGAAYGIVRHGDASILFSAVR